MLISLFRVLSHLYFLFTGTSEENQGRIWKSSTGQYHCWYGKVSFSFFFISFLVRCASLLSMEEVNVCSTGKIANLHLIFVLLLFRKSETATLN